MDKVEINKNINLSQHFLLGELTKTSVKTADGLFSLFFFDSS